MGGWGGGGYGSVGGVLCTHACTCTHMKVKHAKHAKHGCLHVGSHLQFLYMYTCACRLQIINDIEALSSTLHSVNASFI